MLLVKKISCKPAEAKGRSILPQRLCNLVSLHENK